MGKSNHEAVLRLLSSEDVTRNKLYNHNKCYDTIRYHCNKFTKSESDKSSSMCNIECKHKASKKVISYLKNSQMSNPGNFYSVMELETMYSDLLKSDNIHHNNHPTTFADLLVKSEAGLNKKKQISVLAYFLALCNWLEHVIRNLLL